jgi:hypothetical protein
LICNHEKKLGRIWFLQDFGTLTGAGGSTGADNLKSLKSLYEFVVVLRNMGHGWIELCGGGERNRWRWGLVKMHSSWSGMGGRWRWVRRNMLHRTGDRGIWSFVIHGG